MSDFERAVTIIGAVGVAAAIARNTPYSYYRYHHYPPRPVVIVERPAMPIIVDRPYIVETPVIVEREVVVEREVLVDRPVYIEAPGRPVQHIDPPVTDAMFPMVSADDTFSPKMGAFFRIADMEIPNHQFTAAVLTSDPLEGSPLYMLGLEEGDVITRVAGMPIEGLDVLDLHERQVEIRFIKANTVRVQAASVYIPTDDELWGDEEIYLEP